MIFSLMKFQEVLQYKYNEQMLIIKKDLGKGCGPCMQMHTMHTLARIVDLAYKCRSSKQERFVCTLRAYKPISTQGKARVILGFRLFSQLPPHKRQAAMGGK